MNQTLPTHPLLMHSPKPTANKSGDSDSIGQVALTADELLQEIDKGSAESRPDLNNPSPDNENEFATAFLVLSPIDPSKNLLKNMGQSTHGQTIVENKSSPRAETITALNNFQQPTTNQLGNSPAVQKPTVIQTDTITLADSTLLIAPKNTTNPQDINLPANKTEIAANTQIIQPQISMPAAQALHIDKSAQANPRIRTKINAQTKPQIDTQIDTRGAQISLTDSIGKTSAHPLQTTQSQTIVTQLGDAVAQQIPKAISEIVPGSSSRATSPTQTNFGQPPKPILVQLSPAELGRVHIQFSFDASEKITAHIIAESAETGTLLKQNSDLLVTYLKRSGFDNIDLNFETKTEKTFSDISQNSAKNNSVTFVGADERAHDRSHDGSGRNEFEDISPSSAQGEPRTGQPTAELIVGPASSAHDNQLDITI